MGAILKTGAVPKALTIARFFYVVLNGTAYKAFKNNVLKF